jgi:predicted kinase
VGNVVLELENSRGRRFEFSHSSRSITGSAMIVTLMGVEYFVNTERAFVHLNRALQDAKRRNRSDLAERYQIQIATIVENTSYSEVIERMRAEDQSA